MKLSSATLLIFCSLLNGCAYMDSHLNIDYDPVKAEQSALSSVPSLKVKVDEFKDGRFEPAIAYKNVLETGAVLSQRPMAEVIRDAVRVLLKKNGHILDTSNPQLMIEGDVQKMAMGFLPGVMTTEAVGTITVRLNVKAPNGKVIFTKELEGEYHQRAAIATMKTWEQVFNGALENLVHNIAVDKGLLEVFAAQTTKAA